MKNIIFLLLAAGIVACSNTDTKTPSSSTDQKTPDNTGASSSTSASKTSNNSEAPSPVAETKTGNTTEPSVAKGGEPTALTDKEKAQITDEFLVFNAKAIRASKSDDCDNLAQTLKLLYARQIIYDRFPGDIASSSDISQLIGILEAKLTSLSVHRYWVATLILG
jgi:hypothetical protein